MIRYWLWRISGLIWRNLPPKVGYACATFVADIVYLAWPRGRNCARENMARVLGEGANAKTVDRLARQSLRNYCKYLVDFIRFPLLEQQDIEGRVVFHGWRHVDEALERGKGAIFIGLHMGNWDIAAAAISLRQYPLNAIAESLKPKTQRYHPGHPQQAGHKGDPHGGSDERDHAGPAQERDTSLAHRSTTTRFRG